MSIVFERQLSPFLTQFFAARAALDSRVYNSVLAVELTLKDLTKLRYATAGIVLDSLSRDGASVAISPLSFSARLSGAPDIRVSQTRSPDINNVKVINLDYLISSAIPDNNRVYDNCKVKVYLCFEKPDGAFEGLVMFDGLLTNLTSDDEDADLSSVADLSHAGALAGREIPQRCVNELGDSWCGVPPSTLPVGAVCSKQWNDAESGCMYWGGVYNGIPFIAPNVFGSAAGTGQGTGWEEPTNGGNGGCPDVCTTIFQSANGGYIKGVDMQAGESIIAPSGLIAHVTHAERIFAPYRYLVRTSYGAGLIVSAKHRFLRSSSDPTGAPAVSWKFREWGLLCKIDEIEKLSLPVPDAEARNYNYSFQPTAAGEVLNMSVTAPNTYWAGMEAGKLIGCHNQKNQPWHGNY